MDGSLLSTKLYIPTPRPASVARPHLLARLDACIRGGGKLILVCAPAGFGKTSLLVDWLHAGGPQGAAGSVAALPAASTPLRAAWVSLDQADNDPTRFWSYVMAALEGALSGVGAALLQALQTSQPPPIETLLALAINALDEAARRQGPLALVLDDYHLIDTPAIHSALTFLLDRLPPQVCLILTSRADPPLPLARWRARNQLVELRAADLRFTPEEAARFFGATMGLTLTAPDVAALEARTEGWAAGLHLAALALQGRPDPGRFVAGFAGSHRYVVDYLVEEVIARQPAHIQRFLLQTVVLERMCGPLCDALLGVAEQGAEASDGTRVPRSPSDTAAAVHGTPSPLPPEAASYSQLILHALERANLFTIALDDERRWYRYHHLFAEVLRERLRAGAAGAAVAALHARASGWFEQHGFVTEAIEHALGAADWPQAAHLLETCTWPVVFRGEIHTVQGWFAALPPEHLAARPMLSLHFANLLMHTDQLAAATVRVHAIAAAIPADAADAQTHQIHGVALSTLGNISFYQGDLAGCVAYGRQALECMPEDPPLGRVAASAFAAHSFLLTGDVTPTMERHVSAVAPVARAVGHRFVLLRALTLLAQLQTLQGRLQAARASYREAEQIAPEPGGVLNLIGSPGYSFGLGDLYREWNQLDAAELHLREGMERALGGLTINASYFGPGAIALARLQQASGDPAGAHATLERLAELGRQRGFDPLVLAQGRAAQAQLWLAQGELGAAIGWAETSGLRADEQLGFPRELEQLTLARVLIARGRAAPADAFVRDALTLLDRLLGAAEAGGRRGSALEIHTLRALALEACGDTAGAQAALGRALALAAPEGYMRLFLDEGGPMHALLGVAARSGANAAYAARLLGAFALEPAADGGELRGATAQGQGARAAAPPTPVALLIEPLSERELEVLRLVESGHSNQAIADTLIVAVGTVKKHINNIYAKLEVGSRTQALARAHALQLL